MKKVLIVSRVETHPTRMGNNFAILAQVEILKKLECEVYFLYVQDKGLKKDAIAERQNIIHQMKAYWGDHLFIHKMTSLGKILERVNAKFRQKLRGGHFHLYDLYVTGTEKVVAKLQEEYKFDACIVQYIYQTKLFDTVKFPKKACFTHDTFAYANLRTGGGISWYDAAQEADALQKCTDVFAIQGNEYHYFKVLSPLSNHYTVYTPYEYHPQKIAGNKNMLFLSGSYQFNVNGLSWFINEVLPVIRSRHPEAKLLVAGGICKVLKNKYENIVGVELLGFVDDPKDFFAQGDVAINPTFQGTGLKIKTFEAIANDKVTLAHPHSMSGVYDESNAPVFASDVPSAWADYLDRIWGNPDMISDIKKQDRAYIENMNLFIEKEYKRFIEY